MRLPRLARPSPAFVVSVVALMVALGGTSYAAFSIPKNSVGSKQLKKNAVTNAKIGGGAVGNGKLQNGSVSGAKIRNGAITGAKLNLSQLGTVPSATNANVATNAGHATTADTATNATNAVTANTAKALGSVSYAESAAITAPKCSTTPCDTNNVSDTPGDATCPAEYHGHRGRLLTTAKGVELNEGEPRTTGTSTVPNDWHVFVDNFTQSDVMFNVVAICTAVNAADNPAGFKAKAPALR